MVDHLDDKGVPISDLFETRLKFAEQYDQAGFRSHSVRTRIGSRRAELPNQFDGSVQKSLTSAG